jgi:Mg2+/Co2+ transporter CorB
LSEIPIWGLFVILALLIACSAFFSSSETAMMALNRYRLKNLADKGHRSAKLAPPPPSALLSLYVSMVRQP